MNTLRARPRSRPGDLPPLRRPEASEHTAPHGNGTGRPPGRPRADLTGRRIGRWQVLGPASHDALGATSWHCRCACGVERVVPGPDLVRRRSFSCGCSPRGRPPKASRNRAILAARARGETLRAIAARHGLSRQCVHAIVKTARKKKPVNKQRA